jgi:hypothetical protein
MGLFRNSMEAALVCILLPDISLSGHVKSDLLFKPLHSFSRWMEPSNMGPRTSNTDCKPSHVQVLWYGSTARVPNIIPGFFS